MITLDEIKQKWSNFFISNEEVEAHVFQDINTPYGSPLITIDPHGLRHLLIPVNNDFNLKEDRLSTGVQILFSQWGIKGKYHAYIDVVCQKPHLNDLFDFIVFDVLRILETDPLFLDKACRTVLNKWRDLLSREPMGLPDRAAVIGLFGELWLIKKLSDFSINAVDFWMGPEGSRFDFISQSHCLEVKTSTQKKLRLVTINGHDQLEPFEGIPLHLAVLKIEELPIGGQTLQGIINILVAGGINQEKLQTKLFKIGITSSILDKLNEYHFNVREERIYRVDESFPSITTSSFKGGKVPNGVVGITYQIDLTSEPPKPINQTEKESYLQQFCI